MFALLLTAVSSISTLIGGLVAIRARRRVHLLLGFGAGAILGAAFFDLLPEAISAAQRRNWSTQTELMLVITGFVLFHLLDRFFEVHGCPTCNSDVDLRRHVGRLSAFGLIGHSVVDGASIAAATLVSWRTGLIVAIGIIAHDMSDGLNTILLVTRGERPASRDYAYLLADASAPIIGGLIVVLAGLSAGALAIFLGLTSGFFLFTSTGDLLPDAHRRSPGFTVSIAMLIGLAFIRIVISLVSTM